MNDLSSAQYRLKMGAIATYLLQQTNVELREFLSVFPHNTMEIKKAKADKKAYASSSIVWETYPAVREAAKDIEDTLYLACNNVFVPSLIKEVAKLQRALELVSEAYRAVKDIPQMNEYSKQLPSVVKKPKDLGRYLVSDLEVICEKYSVDLDRKSVFDTLKAEYNLILEEEK